MKKIYSSLLGLTLAATIFSGTAQAGKIVLANDEWTLSNSGYGGVNDPGVFATNVASWFTGGSTGNFLAYSSNFGLTGSSLASSMTSAGHNWTVSTAGFTLANLQTYDGVFLAGNTADNAVLTSYVNGGGNVYLAGGTGGGGASAEAAQWNSFLNAFGLGFANFYNGISGNIEINNSHQIFAGVDHLYQNNGQNVLDNLVLDPQSQVLVSYPTNGYGLYAVYESSTNTPNPIPEPATMLLMGSGLAGLVAARRRKKA